MTPEAQRTAIAEACGWKHRDCSGENQIRRGGMAYPNRFCALAHAWWHETDANYEGVYANPPDYLNNLNAMHEAEKTLDEEQFENFRIELFHLAMSKDISATAAQRAEAFLRTLNLWTE